MCTTSTFITKGCEKEKNKQEKQTRKAKQNEKHTYEHKKTFFNSVLNTSPPRQIFTHYYESLGKRNPELSNSRCG